MFQNKCALFFFYLISLTFLLHFIYFLFIGVPFAFWYFNNPTCPNPQLFSPNNCGEEFSRISFNAFIISIGYFLCVTGGSITTSLLLLHKKPFYHIKNFHFESFLIGVCIIFGIFAPFIFPLLFSYIADLIVKIYMYGLDSPRAIPPYLIPIDKESIMFVFMGIFIAGLVSIFLRKNSDKKIVFPAPSVTNNNLG